MIYARSSRNPRGTEISATRARTASSLALVAYPAGALILRFAPDTLASTLLGYGLILLALAMAGLLSASSIQRIASEEPSRLDEFERVLRHRALGFSYACFSALTLLAVLYAGIASDIGAWVPSTFEEFNGLFWGVFLYATVLPSAFLAWTMAGDEEGA